MLKEPSQTIDKDAVRLVRCQTVYRVAVRMVQCQAVERVAVRLVQCQAVDRVEVRLVQRQVARSPTETNFREEHEGGMLRCFVLTVLP